jgi:hypothetical protein
MRVCSSNTVQELNGIEASYPIDQAEGDLGAEYNNQYMAHDRTAHSTDGAGPPDFGRA